MNILFFLKPKATVSYLFSDFTIRQALEKMEREKFSTIPVLNRDGSYYGSLSEGDILWEIKSQKDFSIKAAEELRINEIKANRSYKPINVNENIENLIQLATDQNFVPVIDDRGMFIGIVTRKDIIKEFLKNQVNQPNLEELK